MFHTIQKFCIAAITFLTLTLPIAASGAATCYEKNTVCAGPHVNACSYCCSKSTHNGSQGTLICN